MSENGKTEGLHHVGLTVKDLERSKKFFTETLGYQQVGEIPDYPAVFLSDDSVMVTLWQVENPEKAVLFDRHHNIGLHHLAIRVKSDEVLDSLHKTLSETDGVTVEFAPEPLMGGPTRHMMCTEPGGNRLEFIASAK